MIACRICNCQDNHPIFEVKEMEMGMRDKFNYFECTNCGCLQIIKYPENIGNYYPKEYYAYKIIDENYFKINPIKRLLKKKLIKYYIEKKSLIGKLCSYFFKNPYYFLEDTAVNFNSSILDIGCGSGSLILDMKYNGFSNLRGSDPFIEKEIQYRCGIQVDKKDLFSISGKYDLVMLHHSLEHMPNQHDVFRGLGSLIKDDGTLIIRIPVASFAWKKYGVNWYGIVPPRHYYLHTEKSMEILADKSNLKIERIRYDSDAAQFYRSEEIERDIAYPERDGKVNPTRLKEMEKLAKELNATHQGGQACFYLKKK